MIKNKIKISIISVLVIAMLTSGAMAAGSTIATEGAISTGDRTPEITFTVTGVNGSSFDCNLWIGNASGFEIASGTCTALDGVETSITCNRSLAVGTYTYNVSAYNSTEVPTTSFSSDASLKVTTFGVIISMLTDLVNIFTPILAIVIKIIPILIALAIATFILTLLGTLFGKIKGKIG